MSDGTTHYAGCIQAGPKHYECALQEIGRLRLTITGLRVKLEKKEWVGLTGPEVDEAYGLVSDKEWAIGGLADARVFFCAIEAKLKEKNNG